MVEVRNVLKLKFILNISSAPTKNNYHLIQRFSNRESLQNLLFFYLFILKKSSACGKNKN